MFINEAHNVFVAGRNSIAALGCFAFLGSLSNQVSNKMRSKQIWHSVRGYAMNDQVADKPDDDDDFKIQTHLRKKGK